VNTFSSARDGQHVNAVALSREWRHVNTFSSARDGPSSATATRRPADNIIFVSETTESLQKSIEPTL
jgi:hypothetical protein